MIDGKNIKDKEKIPQSVKLLFNCQGGYNQIPSSHVDWLKAMVARGWGLYG